MEDLGLECKRRYAADPERYRYDFGLVQLEVIKEQRERQLDNMRGISRYSEGDEVPAPGTQAYLDLLNVNYRRAREKSPSLRYGDFMLQEQPRLQEAYRVQQRAKYQAAQQAKRRESDTHSHYRGSAEESEAIKAFMGANRTKYNNNYIAAAKDYRNDPSNCIRYSATAVMESAPIKWMRYRGAISPQIIRQENGLYTLRGIPIFECHDREDIHCDERWMQECVHNQRKAKEGGFLPRLSLGHTSDNPGDPEKPCVGYADNFQFDSRERWLFADFVDISPSLLDEIKSNRWPGRSVEASRSAPRIDVIALLGSTPPYFKLPDLKYESRTSARIFSECRF